jgi:hypothetical protein
MARFSSRSDLLVSFVAQVGEDGEVKSVSGFSDVDPDTGRLMGAAVLLTRFKPATCHGQACAMAFPMTFRLAGRRQAMIR